MNKTGQMIEFEEETGEYAIVTVKVGFAELQFPSEVYVEWLEAELLKASVKAAAYDRLMGGKGCVYCNGPESLISDSHIEVEILDGKIHATEDEFGSGGWVKISYCPMCGKTLTTPRKLEASNGKE